MTCENENNALAALLPLLTNGDDERFKDALGLLLNAAMILERQQHLRAAPYERTQERRGHANGFKNKDFQTRLGALNLQIPQVRDGGFYPQTLEKGLRSEGALKIALAQAGLHARVNKEVKRRTRVATLLPSEASCLRLVSAVLMEISDDWEAGKAYLTFTP